MTLLIRPEFFPSIFLRRHSACQFCLSVFLLCSQLLTVPSSVWFECSQIIPSGDIPPIVLKPMLQSLSPYYTMHLFSPIGGDFSWKDAVIFFIAKPLVPTPTGPFHPFEFSKPSFPTSCTRSLNVSVSMNSSCFTVHAHPDWSSVAGDCFLTQK